MIARYSLIGICLCGASLSQTSADNPRLKAALERYPAADADKDGILTLEEAKISPLTYSSSKQPPCIMFFGTADDLLEGAQLYQKDSEKAGNSCKILTYEGQGHGFFNYGARGGKHYNLTLAEMDRFLVDLGWLKQK